MTREPLSIGLGRYLVALLALLVFAVPATAQEEEEEMAQMEPSRGEAGEYQAQLPASFVEELGERGSISMDEIGDRGLVMFSAGEGTQSLVMFTLVLQDGELVGRTSTDRVRMQGPGGTRVDPTGAGGRWRMEAVDTERLVLRGAVLGTALPVDQLLEEAQAGSVELLMRAAEYSDVGESFVVSVVIPLDGAPRGATTNPLFFTEEEEELMP